jgi:hypothetical protein
MHFAALIFCEAKLARFRLTLERQLAWLQGVAQAE